MLVAAGALLVLGRSSAATTVRRGAPPGGNVGACAALKGDAARACYSREVGRELAAVGGAAPHDHVRGAGGLEPR